jgi:DNA-binding transcriptional regulator YiaG
MGEKELGVTSVTPIAVSNLKNDLHTAFKLWHKPDANSSPLNNLYLFQQAQRETGNTREATNQVILKALQALEADQAQRARILRMRFLDQLKVQIIARRLNVADSTVYKWQGQALTQLARCLSTLEDQARAKHQASLEQQLNLPPPIQLFGVEAELNTLLDLLALSGPPWLLSIEGIGGIGKTALANALIRELALTGRYQDLAWISAKQQDFLPHLGLQPTNQPALDPDTFTSSLLEQLNPEMSVPTSPQAKMTMLISLLKEAPYLIVVDNLETVVDYQTLLPTLRKLADPTRFLLTSRHSLQAHPDVYCLSLKELNRPDTLAFLKYEAQTRGISSLLQASQAELESIYQVVGGNPLALKLIAGQIGFGSLAQVLDNLKQASGKKVDDLFTHIFWQAWHALDSTSQQVLLVMPLAQDGDFAQLAAVSKLAAAELNDALEHLITLSLVEVAGDNLADCRYRIHRLTETFLLTEVAKWQRAA